MTIVILAVGGLWLLTVLAALFTRHKVVRIILGVTSAAFAAAWLMPASSRAAAKEKASATSVGRSCATVQTGDTEQTVHKHMGDPNEKRGEEELRGAGAQVWIYRDSRCAVHFLDGVVESVD